MSSGKSTFKGINAQAAAGLSLFLQYLTRPDFKQIELEQSKLEDFVLVFDEKRIICESKYRSVPLEWHNIREILETISKHKQISKNDEILIITEQINPDVKGAVENFKYFGGRLQKELKNSVHKFTDEHISLLPRLKIWEVPQEINDKGILVLMAQVLNIGGNFWLPSHQLNEWTKKLLVDDIYHGSQKGKIVTRSEILEKINNKKVQFFDDSGYKYEEEKETTTSRVEEIIKNLKNNSRRDRANNEIARLPVNPSVHYFVLQKLQSVENLKLADWDALWKATLRGAFSLELFKVLEKNIDQQENQEYSLSLIENAIENYEANYYREEFIKKDIVDLCQHIFQKNHRYAERIFRILKSLYAYRIEKFLYSERKDESSWEREEISKFLKEIYQQSSVQQLKVEIVNYILGNFNIVEDDGKFWHYTPPSLFEILADFVIANPAERILELKDKCSNQYQKYYRRFNKKISFDGWEHMGGGIGQSGNEFSIIDKHFVVKILTPALQELYKDKEVGWSFVISNCIARQTEDVTRQKPDFLNRASLPILLEEYKGGSHSNEAREILSDFIKMRKGIPWKNDLIFQSLNSDSYSDEQKWELVSVSLKAFSDLPVNVFVEQIVSDLAAKSDNQEIRQNAVEILKSWASNPEYQKRHSYGELDTVDSALKLINNPKSKSEGIDLIESYIQSDHFKAKRDTFDAYDVAGVLSRVLEENFDRGLALLNAVNQEANLTTNQQILICSSLYKTNDNNPELLKLVFENFVKPLLSNLIGKKVKQVDLLTEEDFSPIEERFSYRYARESLIQFAEKLAKAGHKKDALWMTKIFILDSDPPKDGSNTSDDPKGESNLHKRVSSGDDVSELATVRGYCAWTLQKLVVPFSEADQLVAREIIPECLRLVKILCFDSNFYVRAEGCIPLIELVKNRHTHLPGKTNERFVSEELAEEMERLAFDMLTDENIRLNQVAKHLAMVFTYIRTLGTDKALQVIQMFLKSDNEDVISEILPLFIYYSLFRQNAFPKWQWKPLEEFDQTKIQSLLESQLKNGNPKVRAQLAWQLERLPDEIKKSSETKGAITLEDAIKLSSKYMTMLLTKYDHDVFNDIYHFIEEYHTDHFEICYELWTKCIDLESKYYQENWSEDKLHDLYWWPFFYNGMILETVLDHKGVDEFLFYFSKLSDYPAPVLIANDLDRAVERLVSLRGHKDEINNLFDSLIRRNPKYYEVKQKWIENNHDQTI